MITIGDLIETYFKLRQRGSGFILSKFSTDKNARIQSTFNVTDLRVSNYWIIPAVKKRWNEKISGDPEMEYADYVVARHLQGRRGLRMLSPGCGAGSHEVKFALHACFEEITGIDLAPALIDEASANARKLGLKNLRYEAGNIMEKKFPEAYFDVILFHSSLHHFDQLDRLLGSTLKKSLKANGLIIIHEYVGPDRIQWNREQLFEVNQILTGLPSKYKQRFGLKSLKRKAYRPGRLRMILSDPSEAVESSQILPTLHRYYETIEERPLGGNLIMPLFKDIAHHFTGEDKETQKLLREIFAKEDAFNTNHPSDFVFGIYCNNSPVS